VNSARVKELSPFWDSDEELEWDSPTAVPDYSAPKPLHPA